MASFVIGSEKKFFDKLTPDEQEHFFASCTWFFARRYGKDNVIAAIVHKDETTPHLHLNIVPIHDGRLCCKDLFNRQNLMQLQTDFCEAVGKRYGLERGKEGSQEKHLSTAEYKAKKIVEAAHEQAEAEVQNVKEKAQSELTENSQAISKAKEHFDDTLQKVEAVKAERDKIVEDRNAEADYSKALDDAKNGKFAHGKNGLQAQITALVVENKRLDTENKRLQRDNADLFNRHKGFEKHDSKLDKAANAISLFRTQEREPSPVYSIGQVPYYNLSCPLMSLSQKSAETACEKSKKKSKENSKKNRPQSSRTVTTRSANN